ncbi:sterol desaturase family protein [Mycobacterium stomatepiae]|uniref:Fatty acid hydroxylase n=1 Tax=Mycobacterium stomatepiae TaxID=470076 RepID=A0A7I7Q7D6_9MYCO|nr:sterol desaturase family protein [Mycobacterium stomatepiae]MCV7163097.1 sterol desaturase family protein [Mycobacterium stomatepiae]BBY22254.1 fatty acid hydroxylase [Mycobacterium stomatepiae]
MTTQVRGNFTLSEAGREFWRHPSPLVIALAFAGALTARVGDWRLSDAVLPALMVAAFPIFEWSIHVAILHWRPRSLGRFAVDPLLARKHREHHCDPRQIELIFIPWQTLVWVIPMAVAIALTAFPRLGLGLTYLVSLTALGLVYEWTHYLIHTDYKAKTGVYRSIWRNHRRHHFKNEHYWFTVTSTGTADRLLGTYPNQSTVPTSPTAKDLHGCTAGRVVAD